MLNVTVPDARRRRGGRPVPDEHAERADARHRASRRPATAVPHPQIDTAAPATGVTPMVMDRLANLAPAEQQCLQRMTHESSVWKGVGSAGWMNVDVNDLSAKLTCAGGGCCACWNACEKY